MVPHKQIDNTPAPGIAIVKVYTSIAIVYCFVFTFIFYYIVENNFLALVHCLGVVTITFNYLILKQTGNFTRATNIILATGTVVVVSLFATGGWDNTGFLWTFAYLPFAFFLSERKKMMYWVVLLFAACAILPLIIKLPYSDIALLNYYASLLIFVVCLYFFKKASLNYQEFLKEVKKLHQEQAEKALRSSEERLLLSEQRFQSIIEQFPHPVINYAPSGDYITANKAWEEMWQNTRDTLKGFNILKDQVVNASALSKHVRAAFGGEVSISEPYFYDPAVRGWKGKKRWMIVTLYPVKNADGQLLEVIVIVQDISERKKTEDMLAEERKLLRTLIDNLPDYIYVKDLESRYIVTNKAMIELVGVKSEKETIGKNVKDLFGPELATVNFEEDKKIITTGEKLINREEAVINEKGTTYWMLTSKVPLKDDNNQVIGIIGISHDITEQKKTEILLQELNSALRKKAADLAASNADLQQFVYIASHDLQEPLGTTAGFIELFKRQYEHTLDDRAKSYLDFIDNASTRMKTLIKDLLDYSRIGRKKEMRKVNCNEIMSDVRADLGKIINEKNAGITIADLPVINAYPTELKLLFQNLISNALKFNKKDIAPAINISAQKENGAWKFAFTDNGIGIEEQYKEKIFDIFQRLHNRSAYDGSGIGLAHCKKIVELHNGKIWVESIPGQGSTFYFTIPVMN